MAKELELTRKHQIQAVKHLWPLNKNNTTRESTGFTEESENQPLRGLAALSKLGFLLAQRDDHVYQLCRNL